MNYGSHVFRAMTDVIQNLRSRLNASGVERSRCRRLRGSLSLQHALAGSVEILLAFRWNFAEIWPANNVPGGIVSTVVQPVWTSKLVQSSRQSECSTYAKDSIPQPMHITLSL